MRLTDAGTLLREYADRLLNLRDEVKKGLSELEGLKRGELALGQPAHLGDDIAEPAQLLVIALDDVLGFHRSLHCLRLSRTGR